MAIETTAGPDRRTPLLLRALALLASLVLVAAACSGGGGDEGADGAGGDASSSTTTEADITLPTVGGGSSTSEPSSTTQVVELADVNAPLTGAPAPAGVDLERPAIAVKIDNAPAARPQAGLNQADMVFEEMVEGGLSRLLAVFHSRDAEVVGPVRSARSTDIPILVTLNSPMFAWSGANQVFANQIRASAIIDVGVEAVPNAYERRNDRRAPSNLFTGTDRLRAVAPDLTNTPNPLLEYRLPGEEAPAGARPIKAVEVDYGANSAVHTWDPSVGGWTRDQNGSPHVDTDGVAIAPTNVIVQFVQYVNTGLVDGAGNPVPEAQLVGSGDAWFLIDGRLIEGTWVKENLTVPTQYFDSESRPVKFMPGSTWTLLPRTGKATVLE